MLINRNELRQSHQKSPSLSPPLSPLQLLDEIVSLCARAERGDITHDRAKREVRRLRSDNPNAVSSDWS